MMGSILEGFQKVRTFLKNKNALTEQDFIGGLDLVRQSLREADVPEEVIDTFLNGAKQIGVGRHLAKGVSAEQAFISVCHTSLVDLLGGPEKPLNLGSKTLLMLVGLQGAGKTTHAAKLAFWSHHQGKKPFLVAADVYRPAAAEQLRVLVSPYGFPVYQGAPGDKPEMIVAKAREEADRLGCDVLIVDTAGRLAIDDHLMQELETMKSLTHPDHVVFVCDATMGKDSLRTLRTFHDRLSLTGAILTKTDAGSRAGVALGLKQIVGCPILFMGTGEGIQHFQPFRAEGFAKQILGLQDVLGAIDELSPFLDKKPDEAMKRRVLLAAINYNDLRKTIGMLQGVNLPSVARKILPFLDKNQTQDEMKMIVRCLPLIDSMTPKERSFYPLLINNHSRRDRIVRGAGLTHDDLNLLEEALISLNQQVAYMTQQNLMTRTRVMTKFTRPKHQQKKR